MGRRSTAIIIGASLVGAAATLTVAPGTAQAAGSGTTLTAKDNGDCTATLTLTNYTNTAFYQPDWWFDEEGPAPANGTDPTTFVPPWREAPSTGTNWPYARWVGDPALHSVVADGVPSWPGNAYKSNGQPEGAVSTGTIEPKKATDPAPPPVADDGSYTVWFRINNGPETGDRAPLDSVKITGCADAPGTDSSGSSSGSGSGSSVGSLDLGTILRTFQS